MLLRRLYHDRLAQAGYLLACQASGQALVVDPLRDPSRYLAAARQEGVTITAVAETHIHADFLSGAAALAEAADARLLLSGEGDGSAGYVRSAFPDTEWVRDGDQLRIGTVVLEVMYVPGHTPEHVAFLVTDTAMDRAPMGMLSGDFLFVGDVGRPDLLERAAGVQGTMASSARQLHASLRRLERLPDYLQIWPGHGAGSACGKSLGAVPQSTLGYERRTNWALAFASEEEFVSRVLAGQPEPPVYFARMKRLNASGVPPMRAWTEQVPEQRLRDALVSGALELDVRPIPEFAAGHRRGALSLPLGNSFLGWAGSVVPTDRDVVIASSTAQREDAEHAARDLRLIGIDRVLGVLASDRPVAVPDALATLSSVPASVLGPAAPRGVTVLDVRNRSEWEEGHLPGARLMPLAELTGRLDELRGLGPIVVHCQGGSRSAVAASVLRAAGFSDVTNVDGGFAAWLSAGNTPVTGA